MTRTQLGNNVRNTPKRDTFEATKIYLCPRTTSASQNLVDQARCGCDFLGTLAYRNAHPHEKFHSTLTQLENVARAAK
jgi:hypothetical protein